MAVSVAQPSRPQSAQPRATDRDDTWDKILKGLQVTQGITGIVANVEKAFDFYETAKEKRTRELAELQTREVKGKLAQQQGVQDIGKGLLTDPALAEASRRKLQRLEGPPTQEMIDAQAILTLRPKGMGDPVQFLDPAILQKSKDFKQKERHIGATTKLAESKQESTEVARQTETARKIREENRRIKKDMDSQIKALSDRFDKSGLTDNTTRLSGIDSILKRIGFEDGINTDTQSMTLFSRDIPGFGAGGKKPTLLLGAQGKDLRLAVQGLVNSLLKERSGAAVTPSEALRIERELSGAGTDREFMVGLQNFRDLLKNKIDSHMAGFTQDAAAEYMRRQPELNQRLAILKGPRVAPDSDQSQGKVATINDIFESAIEQKQKTGQIDVPLRR
jgi:hypothetical protein